MSERCSECVDHRKLICDAYIQHAKATITSIVSVAERTYIETGEALPSYPDAYQQTIESLGINLVKRGCELTKYEQFQSLVISEV